MSLLDWLAGGAWTAMFADVLSEVFLGHRLASELALKKVLSRYFPIGSRSVPPSPRLVEILMTALIAVDGFRDLWQCTTHEGRN